jgi:gas vesicle protein
LNYVNKRLLISFSTKETIIVSENNQLLDTDEIIVEQIPHQPDADTAGTGTSNVLAKVAIGAVIGATLGAIAGALANRSTAQRVNMTVKNVGNTVKNAAEGVNQTVKEVGDGIQRVAVGVNDTVKDVGDAVKGTADDVSQTVKGTMNAVKGTAEDVNPSGNQGVIVADKQRTYILVPVDNEGVIE